MSNIKSHKCPSCGGNLNINNEKQLYVCPFCGSTYDYEYFREEQMHQMCEGYLSKREFNAAKEGYEFLLKKAPHDFLALRGMMMVSARLSDIREMTRTDDYEGFSYDHKLANTTINSCSAEDQDYFNKFGGLFSQMDELSAIRKEYTRLIKEKKFASGKLDAAYARRDNCEVPDRSGSTQKPGGLFIAMSVVAGIFAVAAFLCFILAIVARNSSSGSLVLLAILCAVMALVFGLIDFKFIYPLYRAYNAANAKIGEALQNETDIKLKIENLEKDIYNRSSKIRHECLDFYKLDAKKLEALRASESAD